MPDSSSVASPSNSSKLELAQICVGDLARRISCQPGEPELALSLVARLVVEGGSKPCSARVHVVADEARWREKIEAPQLPVLVAFLGKGRIWREAQAELA